MNVNSENGKTVWFTGTTSEVASYRLESRHKRIFYATSLHKLVSLCTCARKRRASKPLSSKATRRQIVVGKTAAKKVGL